MASELSMNGRKKIETLQKEFTQKFPFLTLVFLDKERRAIDISKSLSEVRQAKGADISIIASLKVNTLEKRFLENFGLVVEVAYQKSDKVVYTKDNVDKTLNELNKWCQENDCQPFEFKKSLTGNTLSSVQEQLFEAIKEYYPNAEAKKINKDNYLDIHIPEINKKRGTHLFFNTAKDGIKIGFYCREDEFVENVLSNSSNIEKYAQGIRILNNPLQKDVVEATESALSFINEMVGDDSISEIFKSSSSINEVKITDGKSDSEEINENEISSFVQNYGPDDLNDFLENYLQNGEILVLEISAKDLINITNNNKDLSDSVSNLGSVGIKSWTGLSKLIGKEEAEWAKNEFKEEDPIGIVLLYCNGKYVYAFSNPREEDEEYGDDEVESDVEEENKNNISGDNFIKINISGLGSEICMGLIDNKEFQKFEEFYTTNNFTSTNKAWLAYIEKKGKGYWDYNETANLVGILLDELNIKVFDKNGEEIYNSNYYDIDIEIGDNNWRDYNINESKKRGVYIDKKSDKTLVVYKSNEYFSFDFVVPNTTKFEIEKLTIFYSCTDELGHGNDYGDYSNSLKYNEEVYAATEFGQNNLEFEVKFISGRDKSEKKFVLEQEDEDLDIEAILEEMGYDDNEEEEEEEDDSTNELDEQNSELISALEVFDSETMAMAQMFPQFGITEVGTGSGSWQGNFYTYEYRTEWNEGYLENYDAISVGVLIDLLKTKNINDFNQDDLGSLGIGTLRNGKTSYENFKWDKDVSKKDIKNALEEEELCKGGDIQDSEYLWDSPERIEFVVTEDDQEDLNFILINKNAVIEESENDIESEEEEENYDDEEEEEENDEEDEDDEEEEDDEDEEEEEEEEIDDTKVEFEDYTVTKYGFIDKNGNQVIPCIYDSVYNFDGGIARVQQNGEWFFIDKKGNSIFKNRDIETSSEPGLLKESKSNLYGLIDINGNQVLDFKYDEIDDFSEGFAKVENNNKVGYINKKGIEIISCKYDSGYDFVNGFVNVTLDDKKMILTNIGEVISNNEYDEVYDFNEGLCKVGLENKYGFINQKGEVIVPLIYDEATDFSNGYSCVDYEGKKLLIDKFGKNSLKINYDEILPFSDGLARVSQKDKYGFIDINGIEVIKCKYDAAESFSNGLAEVELKSQKQLIDKTGKVLFNKDFDFISSFQENFVMIQVDSQWGFIDSKANKLTEFIYEDADSFSNGLAAVKMDEKWGYINTLGKEVISFEYESASYFKEDLARVSQIQIIKREKFNGIVLTNNYPVNSYDDIQKLKEIIVKDFKQIRFISKNLQEDESAIKELIILNNKIFPYLPLDIKNKEAIIKIAIEAGYYDESLIDYIDINNKELLEKIISKAPLYFKLIPESSKSIDLSKLAVTKCDEIEFEDLPKSIQSNLGFFEDLLNTIRNNTFPSRDFDKIYVGLDYSESIHQGYEPLFCNNRDFILKYDLITSAADIISENREFCFEHLNKWNNSFERIIYTNPALANDIEFIKLGLSYDMANFGNLEDNYSNNKELLDFAIKNGKGRLSIQDIPESLLYIDEDQNKADINLLTHIVESNDYEITRVPEVIRHNPEYAKSLIWEGRNKTNILYYAPKFLRKDREFVKAVFKINPLSLVFADSSILSDYSFMCDIIKDLPIIIKFCSKTLQRDKNFILQAVRNNGLVFKYITEALKADPEVYWAALKQNVDCFSYLPSSVQEIQSVLEYVSLKNGSLIDKCASKVKSKTIKFNAYLNSENNSFRNKFSISKSFNEGISDNELLSTLKIDPTQIIFLTEQFLSDDRQRLLEILKYSPYPLQFKSCRNILNQNELNQFIKENSWFFKYLDETEKSDSSFIKEMLSINGLLIQYLSNEQKQDLELVKIALKQSTNACRFLSLEIKWETPEAKSIAIELLTQDPSQISYFINLDDLSIESNVEDFFFHAFALDVSVINLINPTRVSTDYSTTPWLNSNVYGSHEMYQDELVLGMNQDGKFFDFEPIFKTSTNFDLAISKGEKFDWEGLLNHFDELELIETAFKYFPNEKTYKALKEKIGEKIESQEYVNPITISETPNLYTLISKDAQGLLDNAIAFIREESELDYSEKFEQLPPSFKTNKIFLDSISNLEIAFEILDAFFDKKILHDEHFITTYLKKNYHEYINLPENLQTNRNVALSYGINYVEPRFSYDKELELNEKFKNDKLLLIDISSKNLNNNFTITEELLSDQKFLFEIIKFQPQLIQSISKDSLNSKLIIDVLKININAFDYLEPEEMLIPEVLNYIIENNPSKIQKLNYSYTIIELIGHLKGNPNLTKVINLIESDEIIKLISDFHPITTKVFNGDSSSVVSDIGTLYHVNGYCEFTLGYDDNCYLSEDIAGVIDYEVINEFLESDESWSDYIWGESWHDYDSIYHSYGITEPATDLKLPNEEIVSVNLKYETPEYDKFKDCFKSSELGDFVHIASSDEKSYSWEGWKRHKLEVAPGIFDVNRISVEFEGDIVSGYVYNYNDGRSDGFEEISDYSTSGKGFTGDLYFNNGKALISVDSDELKEALSAAGIEYDEHEKLKEFCEKFYRDKKE